MKSALLSTICFLFFAGYCFGQSPGPYQSFKLDDKYCQIQEKNSGIVPKNYQLTTLKGFILDCSGYDFSQIRVLNSGADPEYIFIISSPGKFLVKLNLRGETVIDRSTMHSIEENGKEFSGFIQGDKIIIAIGSLKQNTKNQMLAYWAAMIDVK